MAVMMLVLVLDTQPDRMDQIVDQPTPSLALSSLEEVARVGMRHQIELKTYDLDLIREIVKLVWTFQSFEEIL